jgi:hypothetical protein|tara:strand:+ start:328 stop:507 length:180 start_codon:yes stop_codon:yes gene_type:complete
MDEDILNLDMIIVSTGEEQEVYDKIEEYFDCVQTKIDNHYEDLSSENSNLLLHPHFEGI